MHLPRLMWLLAVAVGISGCGVAAASPSGSAFLAVAARDHAASGLSAGPWSARRALTLWTRFPVATKPRPVVPIGSGSVVDPRNGFRTDADKIAFIEGRYVLKTTLPTTPRKRGEYTVMSARGALALMRANPGKVTGSKVAPLAVTRIRLTTASFLTDRGTRHLPAWAFSLRGVAHPVLVLALAPPSVFIPPHPRQFARGASPFEDDSARLSTDGMALRISFTGGPAGHQPCDIAYTPEARTSTKAVAFWVTSHPVPTTGACSLVGYTRSVTIHLSHRLGARVLIDAADGGPVAVQQTH